MKFSQVGCCAILFSCVLIANSLAQEPIRSTSSSAKASASDDSDWEKKLEAALARKISLDVTDIPLKDVVKSLSLQVNVPFYLTKKIEDAGVQPDQPVTAEFVDLKLETVLNRLLGNLNLTFLLKDEMILITTIEDASSPENLITRVYPVKDLVDTRVTASAGEQTRDFDPLIDLVISKVDQGSWENRGASVSGFEKSCALVVSNRRDIHQRVAQLLAELRKAKAEQVLDATKSEAAIKKP